MWSYPRCRVPRVGKEVTLGVGGIADTAKAGTVVIDRSTSAPATAKQVYKGMKAKGIAMLEAPVSGGMARATDGTIVIMVGGDATVFEQNPPLLKSFGGEVIHVGEIGYGSTAKLINNMLAFCNAAAAAEALMIGKRSSIDLRACSTITATTCRIEQALCLCFNGQLYRRADAFRACPTITASIRRVDKP